MPSIPPSEGSGGEKLAATSVWARRLVISLSFLVWLVLLIIIARLIGYVGTALLILILAALIAYAVQPLVGFFHRIMPRALAILLVYLVILGVLGLLFYLLITTSVAQVAALATQVSRYLAPGARGKTSPIMQILQRVGITPQQMAAFSKSVEAQLTGIATDMAKNAVPLLSGIVGGLINVLLTAIISIYLLVDGRRVVHWVRRNAPLPVQTGTERLLDILQRVVGGYIRGEVVLCGIIGLLVGLGMFILNVPYAIMLGTLAFFLEFIPVIGTLASGVICCLLALTQGWITFVLVLCYFIGLHALEGYVLAPHIVGRAVGVHPAVTLLALAAGSELFGVIGAVLAAPAAGLIYSVIVSFWLYYRESHKEQFPEGRGQVPPNVPGSQQAEHTESE